MSSTIKQKQKYISIQHKTTSMKPNILIVEDEPIIAKDIESYMNNLQYNVIGIAHNSERALDILHSRQVDIVLLDIHIDGVRDGIEIAEIINEKYDIPFIYLTSFSDEKTLGRAKTTKPYGYIVKPFDENDLKTTLTIALHNYHSNKKEELFSKDILNMKATSPLSDKEYNVIVYVSKGKNTADIASAQFISVNTVKFHLKNIYQKMNVSSRSELLAKVMR